MTVIARLRALAKRAEELSDEVSELARELDPSTEWKPPSTRFVAAASVRGAASEIAGGHTLLEYVADELEKVRLNVQVSVARAELELERAGTEKPLTEAEVLGAIHAMDCARCGHSIKNHRTPGSECAAVTGSDVHGWTYCQCASFQVPGPGGAP